MGVELYWDYQNRGEDLALSTFVIAILAASISRLCSAPGSRRTRLSHPRSGYSPEGL